MSFSDTRVTGQLALNMPVHFMTSGDIYTCDDDGWDLATGGNACSRCQRGFPLMYYKDYLKHEPELSEIAAGFRQQQHQTYYAYQAKLRAEGNPKADPPCHCEICDATQA